MTDTQGGQDAYEVVGEILEYFDSYKLATWAPIVSIIERERRTLPAPTADRLADWQPIETAPKDGTAFLAYWPSAYQSPHSPYPGAPSKIECPFVTCWHEDEYDGWWSPLDGDSYTNQQPTHWMPLPKAPL